MVVTGFFCAVVLYKVTHLASHSTCVLACIGDNWNPCQIHQRTLFWASMLYTCMPTPYIWIWVSSPVSTSIPYWTADSYCSFQDVFTMGFWPFSTFELTLTLPGPAAGVGGSLDSYCSIKPLCSGMGEVVPARTSPTLLPPSPRTVLWLPCFKVSQCINCRDWHCKS